MKSLKNLCVFTLALLLATGCGPQMGSQSAKTVATGSVAGSHTENASKLLERCSQPLGTLAVDQSYVQQMQNAIVLMPYGGNGNFNPYDGNHSTVPVLRLLAQQSGCFTVVGRGWDYEHIMRERRLARSGELRKGSDFGKGKLVAADYSITPSITFHNHHALGGAGMILGAFIPFGNLLGMAASGINNKQAGAILTMVDNRSGIQVAAAEGSSSSWDIGGLFGMLGSSGLGGIGAYANTPEEKLIVAAMMDSFNNLVRVTKKYKPQKATGPHGLGTGGTVRVIKNANRKTADASLRKY